tara:strand:- start:1142 stop:1324 length:183 start_codon:yes stop_codon:yes gene_type:complete
MTTLDIIALIFLSGYFAIGLALFAFLMYGDTSHMNSKDIVIYFIFAMFFWPMFITVGDEE